MVSVPRVVACVGVFSVAAGLAAQEYVYGAVPPVAVAEATTPRGAAPVAGATSAVTARGSGVGVGGGQPVVRTSVETAKSATRVVHHGTSVRRFE
ncbi:MAG: hypothetical protein JXA69_13580 [Phycisphaerae bacterium]|nr:hypothetical protein [Phycisphaerae bacterium]